MKKKLKSLLLKLICVRLGGCWSVLMTQISIIYRYLPWFTIDEATELYSKTYDKTLLTRDFNAQVSDIDPDTFCSIWNLKSLGKEPTCFKNPNRFIDLFLINTVRNFQEAQVFETGLSDIHKLVVTVLESTFPKSLPKIITYRSYNFIKIKTCQTIYFEMI